MLYLNLLWSWCLSLGTTSNLIAASPLQDLTFGSLFQGPLGGRARVKEPSVPWARDDQQSRAQIILQQSSLCIQVSTIFWRYWLGPGTISILIVVDSTT